MVLACQRRCALLENYTSTLELVSCAGENAPGDDLNEVDTASMPASGGHVPGQEEGGTQDKGDLQPGHERDVVQGSDSCSDTAFVSQPQSHENGAPAAASPPAASPPEAPAEAPPSEAPPPESLSPAAVRDEPAPAVDQGMVDEPPSATADSPDCEPSP